MFPFNDVIMGADRSSAAQGISWIIFYKYGIRGFPVSTWSYPTHEEWLIFNSSSYFGDVNMWSAAITEAAIQVGTLCSHFSATTFKKSMKKSHLERGLIIELRFT